MEVGNKIYRTIKMLLDRSEVFKDRPLYRIKIIFYIWGYNK